MEYKRLTKRNEHGEERHATPLKGQSIRELEKEAGKRDAAVLRRLCELEDKIEQGTLIELPCKVGDTVYRITQVVVDFVSYKREWRIHNFQIDSIGIDDDGDFFTQASHENFYFGRDIFSTREEAEKRLLELQGDK